MMNSLPLLASIVVLSGTLPVLGQSAPPKPVPAQVLLLDNYRILEAPGERVGDVYRLRIGKEVREVPANQVLFVGESRDAVQKFLLAQAAKPAPERTSTELAAATHTLFAAKVQPVLMNLCANCHCDSKTSGGFQLERVRLGFADLETTRRNALATTAFVRGAAASAERSLLVKAATAHGDLRDPPLHSRSHPAFKNLELFVQTVGTTGVATKPKVLPGAATQPLPTPTKPPMREDPFDPEVFNRLVREKR